MSSPRAPLVLFVALLALPLASAVGSVGGLRLASPVFVNPDDGMTYAPVAPLWAWDPVAGAASYQIRVNGASSWTSAPSFDASAVPDGFQCARVRALDSAGTRGPFTLEECAIVDRVPPTLALRAAEAGHFYHKGRDLGAIASAAVVVGPHVVEAHGFDREALLWNMRILANGERVDGSNGGEPCDLLHVESWVCSWSDKQMPIDGIEPRVIGAEAFDSANHATFADGSYVKVALAAVEAPCALGYCNTLYADPALAGGLVERRAGLVWVPIGIVPPDGEATHPLPTAKGENYEYRITGALAQSNVAILFAQHDGTRAGTWAPR